MTPEQRFWRSCMEALSAQWVFARRIESRDTGAGVPDVYMLLKGTKVKPHWLELKVGRIRARHPDVISADFTRPQVDFLIRHIGLGLSAGALMHVPGHPRPYWYMHGADALRYILTEEFTGIVLRALPNVMATERLQDIKL